MRQKFTTQVKIPEGVTCEFNGNLLSCKKADKESQRKFGILGTKVEIKDNHLVFTCEKANKKNIAMIKTNESHARNLLNGFEEDYTYKLEICNVHFPMTCKVEGDILVISNFLGEKINRKSKILPGAKVDVKGQQITVTSHDKEKAGQTAANMEKATIVPKKDRRIFQDGIFITEKPGGVI